MITQVGFALGGGEGHAEKGGEKKNEDQNVFLKRFQFVKWEPIKQNAQRRKNEEDMKFATHIVTLHL